jgi:diadenosine tetraphosphate (Ap4A) HIT family hydrolase
MDCPFCKRGKLEDRVFYENDNWIAFLATPYHTSGHCIIAAKSTKKDGRPVCPRVEVLGWGILDSFGIAALASVARFLIKHYKPKDILFSSVRGDINHFHCHLIPLWDHEEKL